MWAKRRSACAARAAALRIAACALAALAPLEAFAVSPLVVDDAGTVSLRTLQLNAGWRLLRTGSTQLNAALVNPVLGVSTRGEVGSTFGYERRDAVAGFGETDAGGATDVLLSTKWSLWQPSEGFELSARVDLKLPVASESRGLGTGGTDVGGAVVATQCWGRTCLDFNAGYVAADAAHSIFGDDSWFLGQAVRVGLDDRWTLLAEIYGLVPSGEEAPPAEVRFNGGPQFSVNENFLVSALVGSAAGRGSPDVTGYVGFSWLF